MPLKSNAIAGANQGNREQNDFYPTPDNATIALLEKEIFEGSIYEPACGDGAISKILKTTYPTQKVYSTDLIDRDYGDKTGIDFITYDFKGHKFDNVITNPPYSLAKEFIEKSLQITNKKVAMLLKLVALESANRYEMWRNSPLETVYVFSKRLKIYKNGVIGKNSGLICFAWFIFNHNYKGKPNIDWIL
jgi:hypothetical protein